MDDGCMDVWRRIELVYANYESLVIEKYVYAIDVVSRLN